MIKEDLDSKESLSGDSIDWAWFGGGCAPPVKVIRMPRSWTSAASLAGEATVSSTI